VHSNSRYDSVLTAIVCIHAQAKMELARYCVGAEICSTTRVQFARAWCAIESYAGISVSSHD
jgi:hypothetical protein